MNAEGLFITRHAMQRFQGRHTGAPPECWMTALKLLLGAAEEEQLEARALRLIANGMRPARYFVVDGWRFVTDQDVTRLLTCERIIYQKMRKRQETYKDWRRKRIERRKRK